MRRFGQTGSPLPLDPSRTDAEGRPIFLTFRRFRKLVYWRLIVGEENTRREGDDHARCHRGRSEIPPRAPTEIGGRTSRHNGMREGFFVIPQDVFPAELKRAIARPSVPTIPLPLDLPSPNFACPPDQASALRRRLPALVRVPTHA